ncbi:hypothetical protein [Flavobacterium sp.]|jgi:hypothetical protein|uniref:hypothetical protein n=1 Tax=Flavobacterium sp. TaxID=239 RepID=UPI0037BFC427
MKEKSFEFGIFLFCVWRLYYNFIDVVPQWLNDAYFVIESFLVVLLIYSSKRNKAFRLVGLLGSIGSNLYFVLQYMDIFEFNQVGAKYFVPSFITVGIIIVGTKKWQHYR